MLAAAPQDQTPGGQPTTQAAARAALLRANSAVAVVIVTVLALAALGLWQSLRATRLEEAAQAELWRALLAEARSTRLGQTLDRRARALEMVRRAAAIGPTEELRAEAVAALALPERHLEATVPIEPGVGGLEFDPPLLRCAIGLTNGDVIIRPLHQGGSSQLLRGAESPIPAAQGLPILFDFAPAGDALSVRYSGGALAVWDLPSGTLRFVRDADRQRRPASRGLFSSDGRHLVAPVFEPDGFAVMDAMSGQMVAHFPDLGSFHHAAVRPGMSQFAAYDGHRVKLVDWQTRQTVLVLPLSYGAFRLAWSPNGRWLAVGGNALEIQVHDVIDGRIRTFRGNRDTIYDLGFDATGQRLAATSSDGATLIWDFADGRLLDIATDRRLLRWGTAGRAGWLVPDRRLELWRTTDATGYSARHGADESADPWQMDISADGRLVACLSPGRGLFTWEVASNTPPGPGAVSGNRLLWI
jgi:WD40 repeat protein